jgi:drug/metabolite transporter (DMT)-like permease
LFGTATATLIAATQAGGFEISGQDAVLLFLFGAMNLGLGLAFFVTGAPLIPAAMAALIGTAEPVLGPLWVWWVHGEVPGARTLVGGGVVLFALLAHLVWQARRQR